MSQSKNGYIPRDTVGHLILRSRKMMRLTQAQAAKMCDMGLSRFQQYERDERVPDDKTSVKIMQKLNINPGMMIHALQGMPDYMFEEEDKNEILAFIDFYYEKSTDDSNRGTSWNWTAIINQVAKIEDKSTDKLVDEAYSSYIFGKNPEMRKKLMLFYSNDLNIKSLFEQTFSMLSADEVGKQKRKVIENKKIVELAFELSAEAIPSADSRSEWHGYYIPSYLISALRSVVDRLDLCRRRAHDAAQINVNLAKFLDEMDIDRNQFDYTHFIFRDQFLTPEAENARKIILKSAENLKHGMAIEQAISYDTIYPALLDAWPYIFDFSATYKVLMELQKLQPADSYSEITPALSEKIRTTLKSAADSWIEI